MVSLVGKLVIILAPWRVWSEEKCFVCPVKNSISFGSKIFLSTKVSASFFELGVKPRTSSGMF